MHDREIMKPTILYETFTLALHIPAWSERTTLRVNGRAVATPVQPGTYARLARRWCKGDKVALQRDSRAFRATINPVKTATFRLVIHASANPQYLNAAQVGEIELLPPAGIGLGQ